MEEQEMIVIGVAGLIILGIAGYYIYTSTQVSTTTGSSGGNITSTGSGSGTTTPVSWNGLPPTLTITNNDISCTADAGTLTFSGNLVMEGDNYTPNAAVSIYLSGSAGAFGSDRLIISTPANASGNINLTLSGAWLWNYFQGYFPGTEGESFAAYAKDTINGQTSNLSTIIQLGVKT